MAERRKQRSRLTLGAIVIVVLLIVAISTCTADAGEDEVVPTDPLVAELPPLDAASSPYPQDVKEGSAAPATVAAARAFQADIISAMQGCDDAAKEMASTAGRISQGAASIYDGYSSASATKQACANSWSQIDAVDVPVQFTGQARAKADEAVQTCRQTAMAKQTGAELFVEIFDGDMRPSKLEEAKAASEHAQMSTLACVAGIFDSAGAAGVAMTDMSDK